MREPKKPSLVFSDSPFRRQLLKYVYPTASLGITILFFVAVNSALCLAASESGANPTPQGGGKAPEPLWVQLLYLALIALAFAWLKLLTDFRQYRGLLVSLLWSWYSWVFIVFIGALSFTFDYLLWIYWLDNFEQKWFGHLSLALGHMGASAAFVYGVPVLAAKVHFHRGDPNPETDKRTTEMNAVFAAIRESLNRRAYAKLTDWSGTYSWEIIKFAAHTLTIDQINSRIITHEESVRLKADIEHYRQSADFWDDRQQRYELLRSIMTRSSFYDLRVRLKQASQQRPNNQGES